MSTPRESVVGKVRDNSKSLAMFELLQKRFREVRFSLGGWAVEKNDPVGRLYLDLLWMDGGVCDNKRHFYFDFNESALLIEGEVVDKNKNSAESAWMVLEKERLSGVSFYLNPVFAPCETPESLEDYKNSSLDVTSSVGEILGLHLPLTMSYGWRNYFPCATESLQARYCRILIMEMLKLEDANSQKRSYTGDEIDIIKQNVFDYKTSLGVMG